MARAFARAFGAPLVSSTVSRLLVDLNRSIRHPQVFSEAMRVAPGPLRDTVVERFYRPYRERVERLVRQAVSRGRRVIHVSSHSFTPELHGKVRSADVGLLYHPGRRGEVALCALWKESLASLAPELRVRRNYPYSGKSDGFTAFLRRRFPAIEYIGIELEINQGIIQEGGRAWRQRRTLVIKSLAQAIRQWRSN